MNKRALYNLSYGMYIVSTKYDGKLNAQIANVGVQITDNPIRIGICLNKDNLTCEMIKKRMAFTLSILSQKADMKLIGKFGFKSGRDIDKFKDTDYFEGPKTKLPIVKEYSISYIEANVEQCIELDNFVFFIAEVVNADCLIEDIPMTYAYYHNVKGGLSSKYAPNYVEQKKNKEKEVKTDSKKYKCTICGYIYDAKKGDPDSNIEPGTPFEDIPEDWVCPICGVGKDMFELV